MSASQRNKGARGERELARLLEDRLGVAVTRNLLQSREGGHDLNGLPVALEVKRQEEPRLGEWWQQAVEQAERVKALPVLAWRQSRQPWRFRTTLRFFSPDYDASATVDMGIEAFCYILRERWL